MPGRRRPPGLFPGGPRRALWGPLWPPPLTPGPANAAKAGEVFSRLRALVARDPVLVVPTAGDAGHYARELASAGVVFGAEVWTFGRLMADIARLCGVRARAAGGGGPPRGGGGGGVWGRPGGGGGGSRRAGARGG